MKRFDWLPVLAVGMGYAALVACGADDGGSSTNQTTLPIIPGDSGGMGSGDDNGEDDSNDDDNGDETMGGGEGPDRLDIGGGMAMGCAGDAAGCNQIDLLFVIDNSGTMGVEQENLARNFPLLVRQLEELTDANGRMVNPDVQIMVTTTDFDAPSALCSGPNSGIPADYTPARGAPIASSCLEREPRFTSRTPGQPVEFGACQNVCPNPEAKPEGAPFIQFGFGFDNIPDTVEPVDIDGDGTEDSAVAQALACVGPQGIDGCGYEAPLENMLQALNPNADWNTGETPFLRPGALLAIAIITDEADCSVRQDMTSLFVSPMFQEVNPESGIAEPSSAMCWNAGVSCAPAGDGTYTSCTSTETEAMHSISRYTTYLVETLRESQGKEVIMLGILGVPPVTEHNDAPPFQPTAGGVFDLVYRDWQDGEFPAGDILPTEPEESAGTKTFDFGIGPGCTGGDAETGFRGQAIPPVRIKEVCESLNIQNDDGSTDVRCCIESICDDDYSDAIRCLTGIIQETIVAAG